MDRCDAVASVAVQHLLHPTRVALHGGAFDCIGVARTTAQTAPGLRDRRPVADVTVQD